MKMRFILLALLTLLFLPAGCVKAKLNMVINSDNSGKLALVLAIRNDAYAYKFGNKKNQTFELEDFEDNKGIVAWLRPKEYKQGNYHYIEATGYFENINKVRFKGFNPTIKVDKQEDGTATLHLTAILKTEEKVADNQVTRDFLKDVEIGYHFKLPGNFDKAAKWDVSGREAMVMLDVDELLRLQEKKRGILKTEIACQAPDKNAEKAAGKELEAFKKELEQAKKEWEQYKKELEQQ